jgi:hypothetical protein
MPSESPIPANLIEKQPFSKQKNLPSAIRLLIMRVMKALFLALCMTFLISCASSNSETKHTVVIKGINDGNTPTSFSVKVYTLYAGPDCNNLTLYRRFGQSGKYFEFFNNNQAIVASSRPPEGVFGCIAIEISTRFRAACNNAETAEDLDGNFPGGTDIDGNTSTGADGQPKVAFFLTPATPLDTESPRDFYFVANGITNCTTAGASNFSLSETNPLP